MSKLFPVTIASALKSIEGAFAKLDEAVETHTNLCAQANADEQRLRGLADAAAVVSQENYEASARAQRIKMRLVELLA